MKLVITNARGILIKSTSSLEQLQTIKFARIAQISTELNETVQIRLNDSRETLLFKMNSTNDVNNMASLLDVYCSLASKLINSSVWLHSSSKTSMLRVKSLTRELPEAITSTRKASMTDSEPFYSLYIVFIFKIKLIRLMRPQRETMKVQV